MTNFFFDHPLRPFFSAVAALGMYGACVLLFGTSLNEELHMFFLGILPAGAYAGFLLTAIPIWSNYSGKLKFVACALAVPLAMACVSIFFSLRLSAALLACFWLILLLFCSLRLFHNRNSQHCDILLALLLMAAAQLTYAYSADFRLLRTLIHLNAATVAMITLRISTLLGAEALRESSLKDPVFIPNKIYTNIVITFLLFYCVIELRLPPSTAGFAAVACGLILLAKLREWHHLELLRKHYICIHYATQLYGAVGYILLGWMQIIGSDNKAPLHLIVFGYIFGSILMIFSTAGLRHSSIRCIDYSILTRLSFICLFAATISSAWSTVATAIFLMLSFSSYLIDFLPIFKKYPFK